jgi:leader peptidase (prepilin peptidase) / N-methyltransferase
MVILIFFILGLAIGSFINVLVYRLQEAEKIFFDRSRCPHCKTGIHWYDNFPILSFILLRGRCRDCKKKISWQYPVVEIFTGIMFAVVGTKFFVVDNMATWAVTVYYLGAIFALITILVYDWLYFEIPSVILWPIVFYSLAFNLYLDWANWANVSHQTDLFSGFTYAGILGGMTAFSFFFLLSAGSKEKWMGMGDAYLAIFLGLFLGWPKIILALFLAFAIGAIYGIILIALGRKKMKSRVPFAPYLVIGTLIAMFFYSPIINWYGGLF